MTTPTRKRPQKRLAWEHVLGALDDDRALSTLLARIQALENKGVADRAQPVPAATLGKRGLAYHRAEPLVSVREFATSRLARECVFDALVYVEDWLEYEHAKKGDLRTKIARCRRRLEHDLFGTGRVEC